MSASATTNSFRVNVRIDERVRTLGAALAATDWPERERRQGVAKAHVVAEHCGQWVSGLHEHEAVRELQALLARNVPQSALFAYALGLSPELQPNRVTTGLLRSPVQGLHDHRLAELLGHYRTDARLEEFWTQTASYWEKEYEAATRVLDRARVSDFLALCFDERRRPVFVPNLLYPAGQALGIAARGEAVCISPPPDAVGESKPWHFDDDPEWTETVAFRECCRATLWGLPWAREVDVATIHLMATAATVVFLQESGNVPEARAMVMMETRRNGLTGLPAAVEALATYVHARQRYRDDVMEGLHAVLDTGVGRAAPGT